MKHLLKILFLFPLFLSCTNTQEEPIPTPEEEQTAIGFAAKVENSRAIADIEDVKANGFSVWGGYEDTNVFEGTVIKWSNGSEWGYNDTKYWTYNNYNFYAVYPNKEVGAYTAVTGNNTSKELTIEGFDALKEYDLMCDVVTDRYGGTPRTVEFQFKHTLTQLEVQLRKSQDNSGDFIAVTGVYFYCKNKGNYTLNSTNSSQGGEWELDNTTNFIGKNIFDSPKVLTNRNQSCADQILVIPQDLDNVYMLAVIIYIPDMNNPSDELIAQTEPQYITFPLKDSGAEWMISNSVVYSGEITRDKTIIFAKPSIKPWEDTGAGSIII